MRLTCFGIVLVLLTSFFAGRTNAQIPERVLFQPGSYAYGMYQGEGNAGVNATETVLVEVPDDAAEEVEDPNATEWEKKFGAKTVTTKWVEMQVPAQAIGEAKASKPPYLAYHRHPITHRIHVVPYQPGYAENPEAYPKHQSKWNLWLSSLPCREQNRPQVQYLGYYDPMPEILEDKPSRRQLLLGYPNPQWTSCCVNRWGGRLAQCPSLEIPAIGPPAEVAVSDQICDPDAPQGLFGGIFAGPRRIGHHGTMPHRMHGHGRKPCPCPYCEKGPAGNGPAPVVAPPMEEYPL